MNVGMLECFTVKELVILFCASADLLINHTIKRQWRFWYGRTTQLLCCMIPHPVFLWVFLMRVKSNFLQGKIQALGQLIMQVKFSRHSPLQLCSLDLKITFKNETNFEFVLTPCLVCFQDTLMVVDPETPKPCKRQVFLFEQLMIFSEPFERKLDWTVYIYRNSIKVIKRAPFCFTADQIFSVPTTTTTTSYRF